MTGLRLFPRLASLLLALGFAATSVYGAYYAVFARTYDALDAARNGSAPVESMGFWRKPPDVKPILTPWTYIDGMGGASRRRIALDSDTPNSFPMRFIDVTKALIEEPTSGWLWLEYTSLCLELPFCQAKADRSHALIEITARREGLIIREEAFMILHRWELATPDMQARAVSLMPEVMPRAGREGEIRLLDLVKQKDATTRGTIKSALLGGADPAKLSSWQKQLMKIQ